LKNLNGRDDAGSVGVDEDDTDMDFKETVYYSANWIHLAKGQAPVAGKHID
jgi:hypothetical protein